MPRCGQRNLPSLSSPYAVCCAWRPLRGVPIGYSQSVFPCADPRPPAKRGGPAPGHAPGKWPRKQSGSGAAHAQHLLGQPLSGAVFPRTRVPDEHRPVLRQSVELGHGSPAFRAEPFCFLAAALVPHRAGIRQRHTWLLLSTSLRGAWKFLFAAPRREITVMTLLLRYAGRDGPEK